MKPHSFELNSERIILRITSFSGTCCGELQSLKGREGFSNFGYLRIDPVTFRDYIIVRFNFGSLEE